MKRLNAGLSREEFESWYRHKIDSNADFTIGREYEDDRVFSAWAAWREQHRRFNEHTYLGQTEDWKK